jgi:hypothetical protein
MSGKLSEIEYTTSVGNTGKAIGDQIITLYTDGTMVGYGISTDSLPLSAGEYLVYAKAKIGDILYKKRRGSSYYVYATAHVMGRLGSGVASATVRMNTWSDPGDGTKEPGSESGGTGTVTRSTNASLTPYFVLVNGNSFSATAGQKTTIQFNVKEGDSQYLYGNLLAFTNPNIYIRKPAGTQIDLGSIVVKKQTS